MEQRFITEMENKIDRNQTCYYPSMMANLWLAIILENTWNLITFSVAVFAVTQVNSVEPSEVGLIITYMLQATSVLNCLVRYASEAETNIAAVERIKEYSDIVQEAAWQSHEGGKPGKDWPQSGSINFDNYAMRYHEGLDLALKGISCQVRGGEKIGIVGGTGAGISSLTMAMFRLVEPA